MGVLGYIIVVDEVSFLNEIRKKRIKKDFHETKETLHQQTMEMKQLKL